MNMKDEKIKRYKLDQFEKFQAAIMSERDRQRKCQICPDGLAYGPGFAFNACHECCALWEKNNG